MSENISELSAKTDHHSKNPRCTEPVSYTHLTLPTKA